MERAPARSNSPPLADTATVEVTVTPVNDAPEAADDQATTPEDEAVEIPVLDNDVDIERRPAASPERFARRRWRGRRNESSRTSRTRTTTAPTASPMSSPTQAALPTPRRSRSR